MPICLCPDLVHNELAARSGCDRGHSSVEFAGSAVKYLDIGVINNMPDAALEATERQFLSLLNSAASGLVIRLSFYSLEGIPRADSESRHVSRFYSSVEHLWDRHLDGLIVTGTEPRSLNLMDEPFWGSLTSVLEWAEYNTFSSIWSCLAAHAAILHMDGVRRRPLTEKRFGVFECARISDHQLMAGTAARFQIPHSRWNELPEDELTGCGYRILTRAGDAGADTVVKQGNSLFVFFQGHLEYEAQSLLLEYRRDIGRYLRKERELFPQMPEHYFDPCVTEALTAFRQRALFDRREELLADFPTAMAIERVSNTWHSSAVRVYANWLANLCVQKERRSQVALQAHVG